MAEYAEYQQNKLDNILNFNYGVELFPDSIQNPVIKKNTREVALIKLKRLLRSNGFAFLAGEVVVFFSWFALSGTLNVIVY